MKIANLLLILLLPVCLGSCAPKVITHIERSYSPRVAAEEVLLYGVGQTVPESAELIGTVKVVDRGASTKCNYDQVVALAKQTTFQKRRECVSPDRSPGAFSFRKQLPPNNRQYAVDR